MVKQGTPQMVDPVLDQTPQRVMRTVRGLWGKCGPILVQQTIPTAP